MGAPHQRSSLPNRPSTTASSKPSPSPEYTVIFSALFYVCVMNACTAPEAGHAWTLTVEAKRGRAMVIGNSALDIFPARPGHGGIAPVDSQNDRNPSPSFTVGILGSSSQNEVLSPTNLACSISPPSQRRKKHRVGGHHFLFQIQRPRSSKPSKPRVTSSSLLLVPLVSPSSTPTANVGAMSSASS